MHIKEYANLYAYKRILNYQPFMNKVYSKKYYTKKKNSFHQELIKDPEASAK